MLDQAMQLKDEIIRLRRDIHQHPELSFQEFRTAKLVADTLAEIGYDDVRTGVGRTGVVAQIGSGDGPTIGIRADMDALPIQEAVETPWKSQNPGVMHACGHDAHTAILLGVAHLLRQSFREERDRWHGNVRLLFQPSEEFQDNDGVGGATAMIADGALAGVDHVIALHVASPLRPVRSSFATATITQRWTASRRGYAAPAGTAPSRTKAVTPFLCSAPSCPCSTASPPAALTRSSHA